MNRAEKQANRYTGYCKNDAYKHFLAGYHQAEKDLALTVDDIEIILDLYAQTSQYNDWDLKEKKEFFEEVLRRFNEERCNK